MPDPVSSPKPLQTAVLGVTGYSGAELVRLLLSHPKLAGRPPLLLGRSGGETLALTTIHPQLSGAVGADGLSLQPFSPDLLARHSVDVLFLATPHEQSRELVPRLLASNAGLPGLRIIDLSGAWRLHSADHRSVYQFTDSDPGLADALQAEAVYGSPELHGAAIATARLVANPGCYATANILALAPFFAPGSPLAALVDLSADIICDSKSGVSGAGKAPTPTTHFMYAADNLSAYKVFGHRHTGELLEQLHLGPSQLQFTPHLLPIPRGILSTIYLRLLQPQSVHSVQEALDSFYADAALIRVRRSPQLPQIQHVVRTPFCDLGFQLSPDGRRLVLISCLDNLLKGASSQAIENLNLMAGWPQSTGLI